MELLHEVVTVPTKHTFTISRGGASEWQTVTVRVRDADGAEGWGEAAPNRFYGENPESVVAALARFRPLLEDLDPWHLEEAEARMNAAIRWNAAAKSAWRNGCSPCASRIHCHLKYIQYMPI